jgi:hypothetical protein
MIEAQIPSEQNLGWLSKVKKEKTKDENMKQDLPDQIVASEHDGLDLIGKIKEGNPGRYQKMVDVAPPMPTTIPPVLKPSPYGQQDSHNTLEGLESEHARLAQMQKELLQQIEQFRSDQFDK